MRLRRAHQLHSGQFVRPYPAAHIVCTRLTCDLCFSFNVLQISPDGLGLPDRNYYYREPDHAVIIYFDLALPHY